MKTGQVVLLVVVGVAGCESAVPVQSTDAHAASALCTPSAGLALTSVQEAPVPVIAPQALPWALAPGVLADDPECDAMHPHVPPSLSLVAPAGDGCSTPVVGGGGDLGFLEWPARSSPRSLGVMAPDGSRFTVAVDEHAGRLLPRRGGFLFFHRPPGAACLDVPRLLDARGNTLRDVREVGGTLRQDVREDWIPLAPLAEGGFLERGGGFFDRGWWLQLRLLDDDLNAVSGWWRAARPTAWKDEVAFVVDRHQRTLVLEHFSPPGMGLTPPPPAPLGRWLAADGAPGPDFAPTVPTYHSIDGSSGTWFADWGRLLPLVEGGVAEYQYPLATPDVAASPGPGWHTRYVSGEAQPQPAPAWMAAHDHTLQALEGGTGYAAVRLDPRTCARTVSLIAPSGRTCFTLQLEEDAGCDAEATLWPDGTLVVQSTAQSCRVHWWPRLAHP